MTRPPGGGIRSRRVDGVGQARLGRREEPQATRRDRRPRRAGRPCRGSRRPRDDRSSPRRRARCGRRRGGPPRGGVAAARRRAGRRARGRRERTVARAVSLLDGLGEVDVDVVARGEEVRHDDGRLAGFERGEGGRHVGLLDVDVSEPHARRGIRMPLRHRRGDRVVQAAHRTAPLVGRGAVRDAHERGRMRASSVHRRKPVAAAATVRRRVSARAGRTAARCAAIARQAGRNPP